MFAKVMSEESLCREMLQRILGVRIRKIEYIEPEKSVLSIRDAKDIRLDVYVEDDENTVYDIYVDGREVEADDFIEKIEKAVAFNNQDKIWRKNVMTLAMEYKTVLNG